MSDHGRTVCKECGITMIMCRCIENHKIVDYGICKECKEKATQKA